VDVSAPGRGYTALLMRRSRLVCSLRNSSNTAPSRATSVISALWGALGLFASALSTPAAAQERTFAQVFTGNFPGQLLTIGNSVVTCDRTQVAAAICDAVEAGTGAATASNNDIVDTDWIDIDADPNTYNSSSADLQLDAEVVWARLYWWGALDDGQARAPSRSADTPLEVLAEVPGTAGYVTVTAQASDFGEVDGNDPYVAFADVTGMVQDAGAGTYTIANVATNRGSDDHFGGWALVVVNRNTALPFRHISVYDGLQRFGDVAGPITANFGPFLTPLAGPMDAQMTFIHLDGDAGKSDVLFFEGETQPGADLANALNPMTDAGNSTISNLGMPVTTRNPAFRNTLGTDIDTFDVSALLTNGDELAAATFEGGAAETNFAVVAGFQTLVYAPNVEVRLTVSDINGGVIKAGDVLEYTATVSNLNALDDANLVQFNNTIPAGTTYVANSLELATSPAGGATPGALSDAEDADTGAVVVDGADTKVVVNLGAGATGTLGGSLVNNASTSVTFRVTVDPVTTATEISTQSTVTFEGNTLANSVEFEVTSNGDVDGPTVIVVQGPDGDNDGLSDEDEIAAGTDPADADSDDDGLIDGEEPSYDQDSDGDGLINALDPDSDDDGLFDGTEAGKNCSNSATDTAAGNCIADADPASTTNPLIADTDSGGVSDGGEDANANGRIDAGETNPNDGADDNSLNDDDNDGLPNGQEMAIGSDPNDADSDDDGLPDGMERNLSADSDGDGLINVLDPDSDNDGLFDGTEAGQDCAGADTDVTAGRCRADADDSTTTSPVLADTDNGGVRDGAEDANLDGRVDVGELDPNNPADDSSVIDTDGDGLSDAQEQTLGSDPNDADTDDDGLPDGMEPNPADDADGDGLTNIVDPDSDNDGLADGTEQGSECLNADTDINAGNCIPDADPSTTTSAIDADSDNGGVSDGAEDTNRNGRIDAGETDPNDPSDDSSVTDTDDDGLSDAQETELGSDPNDADSDDDGVVDGDEANPGLDSDNDGLINILDPDSDNDGLFDGTEQGLPCDNAATDATAGRCRADADPTTQTSPLAADTDAGGARDGAEDPNHNGRIDPMERDPNDPSDDNTVVDRDNDGLSDAEEEFLGSDPADADTDDDGLLDGAERNPSDDTDGDGLINILDPDSDNDGLLDGTEAGQLCDDNATNTGNGRCVADADAGATTTSPLLPDTDGGGARDGAEDPNGNGQIDAGELDPNDPADDNQIVDTDGDGLSDAQEDAFGSDKNDADTDDDGLLDGDEPNPGDDTDGDGFVNIVDPDSDEDGLFDGTERGLGCDNSATNAAAQSCIADADPATTTSPLNADTDGGSVSDGDEDTNANGAVDAGETDPNNPADDRDHLTDTDSDGLSDAEETALGSDPNNADTDNDGLRDGDEPNPGADPDGDGRNNITDFDSDNDGLFDGTEAGKTCDDPDTDATAGTCIPDADAGATTTNPELADTDNGGKPDGDEDTNKNGLLEVDLGETDPNNPADDSGTGIPPVVFPEGRISGGGFDCSAAGTKGPTGWPPLALVIAAGVLFWRRRRA